MLKAALMNKSVEKNRALEAAEELQVVSTLVKQRRDSIEQFTAGGRTDLADKERAEIAVLETYLPPAVSAEELDQRRGPGDRGNRRHRPEGHGQGHEGGHGAPWRARRSTARRSANASGPG